MITEMGVLNVRPGQEAEFQRALRAGRPLIAATPGFISLNVHRCIETPNRFLLLVKWRTLEDHTIGFRKSDRFPKWRELLHHFYDPLPVIEHFEEPMPLPE